MNEFLKLLTGGANGPYTGLCFSVGSDISRRFVRMEDIEDAVERFPAQFPAQLGSVGVAVLLQNLVALHSHVVAVSLPLVGDKADETIYGKIGTFDGPAPTGIITAPQRMICPIWALETRVRFNGGALVDKTDNYIDLIGAIYQKLGVGGGHAPRYLSDVTVPLPGSRVVTTSPEPQIIRRDGFIAALPKQSVETVKYEECTGKSVMFDALLEAFKPVHIRSVQEEIHASVRAGGVLAAQR